MNISSRDNVLLAKLLKTFQERRLPHAFIISSPELSYSREFLKPLTQALLETTALPHADWFVLKPSGSMAQIKTEEARSLVQRVQQTPLSGIRKVIWIEEAERCALSAANTLLKTLEEPPPQTYFFLLSSHPSQLLSTIRSRCFMLRLQGSAQPYLPPLWEAWKRQLWEWISPLLNENKSPMLHIPQLYALLASLESIITAESKGNTPTHPHGSSDEETNSNERESAKRLLQQALWLDIERFIENTFRHQTNFRTLRLLPSLITHLEKYRTLSELNLPFSSAIEAWLIFLAQTLRDKDIPHH
ncbi:MAG: hypothetical protein LBG98_03350 [Puniceicoccales bacterium]|nr:hypothetical protein [Puniceicoccales bacterium]